MMIAYRTRPAQRIWTPEQMSLERYRAGLEPLRFIGVHHPGGAPGTLAGSRRRPNGARGPCGATREPFGATDLQFLARIRLLYVQLPMAAIPRFRFCGMVLLALSPAATSTTTVWRRPTSCSAHESAMLRKPSYRSAGPVLPAGRRYWSGSLALHSRTKIPVSRLFTGLKHRDIYGCCHEIYPHRHRLIPVLLFFVNAFRRSWPVAGSALVLMVVSALVIGGILPGDRSAVPGSSQAS